MDALDEMQDWTICTGTIAPKAAKTESVGVTEGTGNQKDPGVLMDLDGRN